MTDIATHPDSLLGSRVATALRDIVDARDELAAAKRTHSDPLIQHAHRGLQAAVDAARDLHVQWGEIGAALGIARGNAYQRYRKRLSDKEIRDSRRVQAALRRPAL